MSNLEEQLAEIRSRNGERAPMPAPRTELLKPDAFLEEREGRPLTAVRVGLRTPNNSDYSRARRESENDAEFMLALVSVGLCDPNDCRKSHPAFPAPNELIPRLLKPYTIRYLFDRIEQLHLETSPTVPLAGDEELFLLGADLQDGERLTALEQVNLPAANRVRRLASALIEALGTLSDE